MLTTTTAAACLHAVTLHRAVHRLEALKTLLRVFAEVRQNPSVSPSAAQSSVISTISERVISTRDNEMSH